MPATLFDIQRKYGESVYPLYKDVMHEPYMENGKGGFQGVVLYDEHDDKIRCEECGKWYKALNSHARSHKLSATEYKEKYGLTLRTPLVTQTISDRISKNTNHLLQLGKLKRIVGGKNKGIPGEKNRINVIKSMNSAAYKNKNGLCDAQIAARLVVVRELSKKDEITMRDVLHHDKSLHATLTHRYVSVESAGKALGLQPSLGTYEDAYIIANLREWVIKYKKIPTHAEWSKFGTVSAGACLDHFGSWNRAKMMAGLEILIKEVGGKLPKEEMKENLIVSLREYVEKNKKIPMSTRGYRTINTSGLPYSMSKYGYWFGSWTNAKKEAGLDQLLAEIKSKESEPVQEEKKS